MLAVSENRVVRNPNARVAHRILARRDRTAVSDSAPRSLVNHGDAVLSLCVDRRPVGLDVEKTIRPGYLNIPASRCGLGVVSATTPSPHFPAKSPSAQAASRYPLGKKRASQPRSFRSTMRLPAPYTPLNALLVWSRCGLVTVANAGNGPGGGGPTSHPYAYPAP